jgi:hypothetical protein
MRTGAIARVTIEPRARNARAAITPPCCTARKPATTAAPQGAAGPPRPPLAGWPHRLDPGEDTLEAVRRRGVTRHRRQGLLGPLKVGQDLGARDAVPEVRPAGRAAGLVQLAELQLEQLAEGRMPHRETPSARARASRSAATAR